MVELSVKTVRAELLRAAGTKYQGEGASSGLLLGRLFHEIAADMVSATGAADSFAVLADAGRDRGLWEQRLLRHAYLLFVAPRLVQHHAALTDADVWSFWKAVQTLIAWLVDVSWTASTQREAAATADELRALFRPEAALSCELREPGWRDSVRLTGIADLLLRVPQRQQWCTIELKIGRGAPAVDLGQAALYHLILSRRSGAPDHALALLRFGPELSEQVVQSSEVADAQRRLLELICALAGVQAQAEPVPANPEHIELGRQLGRALRNYGAGVTLAEVPTVGPRVLRFAAELQRGVALKRIERCTKEIQLQLRLKCEPIINKEDGALSISVVRSDPQTVKFADVQAQLPAIDPLRGCARVAVGVDDRGVLRFADLADPTQTHALVAGTAGSGKTEWLRTAIASLIVTNTASTLALVLVDPKMVAFGDLKRSPFLWSRHGLWIQGDGDPANIFDDLVEEMNARYAETSRLGVDNIVELAQKTGKPQRRIVLFCDEYFALISESREQAKRIETAISLLGAKGRAAGIHLVLATQQPSRKIITGVLDTNLSVRVGLLTAKAEESRMLLGQAGAERLSGHGDLLFKTIFDPVRLQAPYLPPDERKRIYATGRL
jgi:DNA segregation ATPase FtsK/SpoIIIE, S-DNA-T family